MRLAVVPNFIAVASPLVSSHKEAAHLRDMIRKAVKKTKAERRK